MISAVLTPATSTLTVGQSLDDTTDWAAFLLSSNYSSSDPADVGTPTVTVNYIGTTPDATTALTGGDTNHFSITVTYLSGNTRTFNTSPRTVVHVAPVAGTLAPVNETQGSGTPTVNLAAGFTGQALVYTSDQPWATVSGSTLTIADEVRTGTVRITATNSGGSAFVDLSVAIAEPVVSPENNLVREPDGGATVVALATPTPLTLTRGGDGSAIVGAA